MSRTDVPNWAVGDPSGDPSTRVGMHLVGDYARAQLAAAQRDPRLDRGAGALVVDYLDYLDEADRVRVLAVGAVEEMARYPLRSDATADGSQSSGWHSLPTDDAGRFASQDLGDRQAAWERRELARAEVANGHPHLNALTLVGMFGNMDGFVEQLVAYLHPTALTASNAFVDHALERAKDAVPESASLSEKDWRVLRGAARSAMPINPKAPRKPTGQAPGRWEDPLAAVGLGPDDEHPVPDTMSAALDELTALRHILVHRLGRVDEAALRACPRLQHDLALRVGQFVRLDRRQYRRYSAALRAYGAEVQRRLIAPTTGERADDPFADDLEQWEGFFYVGS